MSQEQLEPRRQLQNIQKTIKKKTIEGNKSAHTKFGKFSTLKIMRIESLVFKA